jgi:Legionella pneumophila major outer membrane protein precursor
MKTIMAGLVAVGATLAVNQAFAGQLDDISTRLDALERENAAIRKENTALQENKRLHAQNESLKSTSLPRAAVVAPPVASAAVEQARPSASVFDAMAADLPLSYKAAAVEGPGQMQIWAEGGAIWSGGDPVSQDTRLIDFTDFGGLIVGLGGGGSIPNHFDLTPKIGWEAATGFDYRFANSLWHISAQFRYGEGGKTNGAASSAGSADPSVLLALGAPPGSSVSGSENYSTSYQESHWLADMTVGRDVLGSGRDAMQLKGGLRVAEFVTQSNISDSTSFAESFPQVRGGNVSFNVATSDRTNARASFLGAGPVIGIQGSIPFAGNWSLDYLGDASILFGTQQSTSTDISNTVVSPAFFGGGGGDVSTFRDQRFASVFSGDIQVGLSYWVMPNLKVGASYRLDALINVQNQSDTEVFNLTPNRYTHGPRMTVTGQF